MGFFKKIFKGIGKVFKKIGKSIKRAFKKVGKWFGKLGVFGQIALSFIPGLGPMLSGLFKGLGQGALRVLQAGLKHANPLVKGASWIIDTARKVVGGVQKGFKTVTSGATSFVKNTGKFLGKQMGFDISGPSTFFGKGGDSVLGRVGKEVSNNFNDFKSAVGDMFTKPTTRADLIADKLATTKIGGYEVDTREIALQSPEMTVDELSQGIKNNLGVEAQSNFDSLFKGQYEGNAENFLKVVQARPGFVNKFINMGPDKVKQWFNAANFQASGAGGTPPTNPLENMKFPDPTALDIEEDEGFFKKLFPGSSGEKSSLLDRTKTSLTSSAANLPGNLLTSAVTQAAVGPNYSMPTQEPSKALDTYTNQFVAFRGSTPQLESAPSGLMGASYEDTGTGNYYNTIASLMYPDGIQGGMYGAFAFPGVNYGMPQQPVA